ncbi:MAG: hypothetical protein NTW32_08380 [Chloroflexi bacterium]|nr:hypothetical protein [Chloroflexota bacterium]
MQNPSLSTHNPLSNIRALYNGFDSTVTRLDCGQKCAVHNPNGKPFCCDICQAIPAAYQAEWATLESDTNLWHTWRGNECEHTQQDEHDTLLAETPDDMLLLACLGPSLCQRSFRILSCRQFPFFPYVTSDYRFIGLAYDWEFEKTCWVISNLDAVTETYRQQFIDTHEQLFAFSQEIFESYQIHSERMRAHYANEHRRIPLLHRNGGYHLISPVSERTTRVTAEQLPQFGVLKNLDR